MKHFKTIQAIALFAIFFHQSYASGREKRSFSWPSFFGGSPSTDVVESQEPVVEETAQEEAPQHVELPVHNLSPGYHYPIWRVHKYNGIELKPMPISLVPHPLQQRHTQIPFQQLPPRQQFHQVPRNPTHHQRFQPGNLPAGGVIPQQHQQNGQQPTNTNCKPKAEIPPELQELANQFGIKDASKLPSLEDAQGLLGTTTRAETIQTIKEIASTPDGMSLIRQFLATDEGAAASEDPSQCDATTNTNPSPQFQQPPSNNVQHRPNSFSGVNVHPGSVNAVPHQQYGIPAQYPTMHQMYGLPNAQQSVAFGAPSKEYYPPQSNIMSLVKNEAVVPHDEYGIPNELSTAHSEHQGYNRQQHEVYGLPIRQPVPFQQGHYAARSNVKESASSEGIVQHQEYIVPHEDSKSDHVTHQEYGLPNEQSAAFAQHQDYGLPNEQSAAFAQHQDYGLPNEQAAAFAQHQEYGLPNEHDAAFAQHQEYNTPKPVVEESNENESTQHEVYGVPTTNEAVGFQNESAEPQGYYPASEDTKSDQIPHQEYGVPKELSASFGQHQEYNTPKPVIDESPLSESQSQQYLPPHHESYGLPMEDQAIAFRPQQGYYPPNEDSHSDHQEQVPHDLYGTPSEDSSQGFAHPQEVYSIPEQTLDSNEALSSEYGAPHQQALTPHDTYGVPNHKQDSLVSNSDQLNENIQQDISVPHHEYSIPNGYSLPHQRFFEPQATFRQPHSQQQFTQIAANQYGTPTKTQSHNVRTQVPIIRQIDGGLDRLHTNLELGQLLTTTARPEAGFLERVGAWTKYFAPPAPTIPIVPPKVTEHDNEAYLPPPPVHSNSGAQQTYTIPLPKIPDLNEPQLDGLSGLPATPELPNIHIPTKFNLPANQGPYVRPQHPLSDFNSGIRRPDYGLPSRQPQPFDGQTVEQFVPDISQLPLDQRILSNDPRTSYGTRLQHDSSPAASENSEQHVAVVLPNQSSKFGKKIDNAGIVENKVDVEQKYNGPQRISSYDSYATGKLNRANDDAIIQLIPTQKPSRHSNQGRSYGQLEESSVIDAIATMTSGFRPIT